MFLLTAMMQKIAEKEGKITGYIKELMNNLKKQ